MLDLDIERFWKDDELAHKENCFSKEAPQVALGIRMSDECVFAELGEEGEPWGYTPPERRLELNKRYNEKALKIVGRKLLRENLPAPAVRRTGRAAAENLGKAAPLAPERQSAGRGLFFPGQAPEIPPARVAADPPVGADPPLFPLPAPSSRIPRRGRAAPPPRQDGRLGPERRRRSVRPAQPLLARLARRDRRRP